MKKIILIAKMLLIGIWVSVGQSYSDVFTIQNFKNNAVISINNQNFKSLSLSDFGKIHYGTGILNNNYIFQGQEYDRHLGLYLFPSRIYSPIEKRFYQPDPKSQYHSPYLFVGSDPVNIIDRNGKEGKPLILYGEDFTHGGTVDKSFLDFKAEVSDAHYVSLSEFMSSSFIPLDEWNGNVYIKGHMGNNPKGEIVGEISDDEHIMRLQKQEGVNRFFRSDTKKFYSEIDGKVVGKRLRNIAKLNKVEVKNIVAGGCNGTFAAQSIGEGYAAEAAGGAHKLQTFGLRKRVLASTIGQNQLERQGYHSGFGRTRYYPIPEGYPVYYDTSLPSGASRPTATGLRLGSKENNLLFEKFAQGQELNEMVNGRIPSQIRQFFDSFTFSY